MGCILPDAPSGALDMLLLCANQTHAHRIAALWDALHLAASGVFPAGFCKQAIEVGPHSNRSGPQLVLFQGSQLSAQQLLAWLQSSYIRRYCHRMFVLGDAPPAASLQDLLVQLLACGPPGGGGAVRVMANNRSTQLALVESLSEAGWEVHPVKFEHVLTVVELQGSYRWSLTPANCLWLYPSTGSPAHADSVATAVYKLEEALAVTGIAAQLGVCNLHLQQLHQYQSQQPLYQRDSIPQEQQKHMEQQVFASAQIQQALNRTQQHEQVYEQQQQQQQQQRRQEQQQDYNHQQQQPQQRLQWALDLGASPGAWTSYLATRCTTVISVDPAQLSPAALLPNVRHVKMSAADAVPEVEGLLGGEMLDLLVCDMNQNPKRVAQMIKALLHLLRPGGHVIMTLKFRGFGRDKQMCCTQLDEAFKEELQPGQCLWLLANTQCERTYIARKKA